MLKIKVNRILEASSKRSYKLETTININDVSLNKIFYIKKDSIKTDINYLDEVIITSGNIEETGVTWILNLTDKDITTCNKRIEIIPHVKKGKYNRAPVIGKFR